jgi:CheY-like chemotaxis protein
MYLVQIRLLNPKDKRGRIDDFLHVNGGCGQSVGKPQQNKERVSVMDKIVIQATHGKTNRILLTEDDSAIRSILSDALDFMGYTVTAAASGEEGLKLFLNGAFDLVVTDYKMPGMDGFALSSHIKEESPSTPIILITGCEKDLIKGRQEEQHFFDSVVFKPFSLSEIRNSIHDLL